MSTKYTNSIHFLFLCYSFFNLFLSVQSVKSLPVFILFLMSAGRHVRFYLFGSGSSSLGNYLLAPPLAIAVFEQTYLTATTSFSLFLLYHQLPIYKCKFRFPPVFPEHWFHPNSLYACQDCDSQIAEI